MRRRCSVGVAVVTALVTVVPVLAAAPVRAATNTTVVLTFDDQWGSQSTSRSLLESHGMRGTFYVNSNRVGQNGNLTWSQLQAFQASGHEIAGHTLDHVDLTSIPISQVQDQVCDDRSAIMSHGITPTDFAYPDGAGWNEAAIRNVVQNCGYSSARRADGLHTSGGPYAETNPPGNVYTIKTAEMPDSSFSLATIEGFVTAAETHGGGIVTIVFHANLSTLDPFLDWLQPRAANGTITQTMAQALNADPPPADTTPPSSSIACDAGSCSGFHTPNTQISLSATDSGSGVDSIYYTTNGSTPTQSSTAYTTPFTLTSSKTVRFRAYDNAGNAESTKSQLVQIDDSAPDSSIKCNGGTCSSSHYGAPVQVTLSATDGSGSGVDVIRYTTDGSNTTISSPAYTGAFTVAATTTVKYRAFDEVGNAETMNTQFVLVDTDAPVSTVACNGASCSGWYHGPVHVSLSASDSGSGVAAIRYTTDGSDPAANGTTYQGTFTVAATATVKHRASDNVGNVEPTASVQVSIDTVAPVAVSKCQGAACSSAWHRKPVKVTLSASDSGSGVAAIHYTTDGSNPTLTSPVYKGPFTLSASRNVRYFAVDDAGNRSAVKTTLVKVDTSGPTVSLQSAAQPLAVGLVTISANASDAKSGVARVELFLDGHLQAKRTKAPFSYSWNTATLPKGTHRFAARAFDKAGNSTTKLITVTLR